MFSLPLTTLEPTTWRQQVLQVGLLVGIVLGAIVYGPSIWAASRSGQWGIIVVDTVAFVTVIVLYLKPRAPHLLRAAVFSLVLYVLGTWLMVEVGPISQIYLLGFSLISTILLGLRVGLSTVGLNAVTLLVIGLGGFAALEMRIVGREMESVAWVVLTMNFLLVNVLLVVALGVVLNALEGIVSREYDARLELERERADLVRANAALDKEMHERKSLETQLVQSRKMEAIGHLAGGVAHDFNNLLTVIHGYSEVLMTMYPAGDVKRGMLSEIRSAAERAANLTRQLLAFSRKQVLAPQVLDLNAVVANMEKMLRRLIGEDISIAAVLDPDLARIQVDPGQLEQVILNLAVNARDSMPDGGRLTIESSNIELGEDDVTEKLDVKPGRYVALTVSDTGCGMSPDVQAQIFEPFFTTKGPGKGTGLGLSTVFGIVKQSEGFIDVYSEVGVGTRFRILFPSVSDAAHPSAPRRDAGMLKGTETVLLVEDEAGVRNIAKLVLEAHGYRVLEAANGREAIRIFDDCCEEVSIIITDVVMPEMNGRELIEKLRGRNPAIRVLYVSGYTDDAIVCHGIIEAADAFLQKPFSSSTLANKIREVLDLR